MAVRYQVVGLMGRADRAVQVPIADDPSNEFQSVRSPEWMIKFDDIVFSSISDFEDHCELYGWYAEAGRFTSGDVSNQLFTSATLRHTDVIVIIPSGGYAAQLQTQMNMGRMISQMTIVHLGNVEQTKVKLQEIVHDQCRIQNYQQQLDRLVMHIQVTAKTDTHFVYDRKGQIKGQMVTSVNYSQNSVFDDAALGSSAASADEDYGDDQDVDSEDEDA